MKKILAIALSLMLVLCLFAGCNAPANNETNKEEGKPSESQNNEATPTDPTPVDPSQSDVAEPDETDAPALSTVTPGKLTMATNAFFPPYEYYEGEEIVGIDAEIAAAIAEKLGLELEIKNMEFNSIITAVTTGAADMGLAGMTITEERLLEVDFSISYAKGVQAIVVKADSPITSYDDLAAEGATYKIGVQLGTTGDIYASDEFGDRVTQYNNGNEAVLALQAGDIDCIIIDNEPAKSFVAANEGLMVLDSSYADEDYAACFAQENDALREAVNAAIEELIMDGTIDAIVEKYIPAN